MAVVLCSRQAFIMSSSSMKQGCLNALQWWLVMLIIILICIGFLSRCRFSRDDQSNDGSLSR
jgi:hypothetical protein